MKKVNFLSNLWSLLVGSRKDDGSTRYRLVIDSLSTRYRVWQYSLGKIAAVVCMLLTIGSGNVWGVSWTLSYTDFNTDGYAYNDGDHTKEGISYNTSNVMRNGSNIQFKASSGTLYNKTAMPGNITKITAGGGLTIKVGAAQNPSSGTTATSGSAISGSYKYFWIKKTNSGAATVGSITVEYDLPAYTVSFDTGTGNPSVSSRKEASGGAGITLPSTSDLTPACSGDGWVLYGWTTSAYGSSSTTTEPTTTLAGLAGTTYKPTKDIKLYAVYRKATVAASATTTTYTLSGNWTTDNGNWTKVAGNDLDGTLASGKYGLNSGSSTAVSPSSWTDIETITFTGTKSGSGAGSVEFLYSSGSSWTSLTSKSIANTLTWSPSPKVTGQLKCVFTRTNGNIYIASIAVKGKVTTYTYWYAPTCETCDDPTALGKGSFNSSTHVQPITWTSEAGKVDICYSTSSTKPDDSPGSGYTVISGVTGYDDESNTYDLDVSSLAPGNYYVWARSVCSASASSGWVAMASPGYFTLPGHTLTIAKSGGGTSTTTPALGNHSVTEGNSVSITASPASGYSFTSWSVSGTGSTLTSTETNPTTFTMGTANSTVTATFSEIKVSSLSLKATQTDVSDKTGNDLTMSMYPGEGQASDPLSHSAKVEFYQVLPSDALDKSYTWSVRVKASGAADWTAVSFSDNELGTNAVLQKFNKNTGTLQAKAAGVAEIKITANDGSGVSAKVTITVTNVALTTLNVGKSSTTLYVGQTEEIAVTYTPANTTTKGYTTGSYTYVKKESTSTNAKIVLTGKSVTKQESETVTLTSSDAGAKTATIDVTIKPLPLVHFVDIIHNEEFDDVVATTDGTTVTFAKTVPTHDDLDAPVSGNDCEKEHLHLIGWIRSDYTKVANYMNGTGDAPTNAEITGAETGYYYAAGASITLTDAMHGKTFYAVWAKVE